jgi:L-demethylnoviosyl transferase
MVDLVATWRPDIVVSEPCEYAGRLAAARHDVPWIEHAWGLAAPPLMATAAGAELDTDLPPPYLRIHACPPSLQHPGTPPGMWMRYLPYNGNAVLPPWALSGDRTRQTVCLTFGSSLPRYGPPELKQLLVETVKDLTDVGLRVLVCVADAEAADLGPVPEAVQHVGWLPLSLVLPHCDIAVHHGGTGTAMSCVASGVPQLVIPQATDQFGTAERLSARGVALRLSPEQISSASVRQAVLELLRTPSYRENARSLAEELAALPSPAQVAAELGQLAEQAWRTFRPAEPAPAGVPA